MIRVIVSRQSIRVSPWSAWTEAGGRGPIPGIEPWHIYRSDTDAPIPDGAAAVAITDTLPVSDAERSAYRDSDEYETTRRLMGYPYAEPLPEVEIDHGVRVVRGDPSWYAHVAPLSITDADTAANQWVSAVDGTIGTEHSNVYLRQEHDRWLAYAGLGSHMIQARHSEGRGGCAYRTREAARNAAVVLVRQLRTEALERLRRRLDGWDSAAVNPRLYPSQSMRLISGWQPLYGTIAVREYGEDRPRYPSSWDAPIVEEVSA